jgi:ribosomal protein S12 methylthiotransferase
LLSFLDEAEIDRAGCFKFEPVRGAPANELEAPVPDEVKEERYHRFMQAQQKISARKLKRKVGSREAVIIDSVEGGFAIGRTRGDAPEIDGSVHVSARRPLRVGEIVTVKIERADEYDLYGAAAGF